MIFQLMEVIISGCILQIRGNEKTIVNIHNSEGRLVHTDRLTNSSMRLPASIVRGLYIVSVIDDQQVVQGKLVVE